MNDYLPFRALLENPLRTFRHAGLLVFIGLLVGLIVPGILEWRFSAFFEKDVKLKISQNLPDVSKKITEFDNVTNSLRDALNVLDNKIAKQTNSLDQRQLSELIEQRKNV